MRECDQHLLRSLLAREGTFGHAQHLELAWSYLERYPLADAKAAMAEAIGHIAAEHGAGSKYHETMTAAWTQLVAVHRRRWPAPSFERFIARNPRLLDSRLLDAHYSPRLLWSERARAGWVEPDLRGLPQPV